jgi:hypothetical protein
MIVPHKSCAHDGGNNLDTILLFSPLEIEDMQYLVGTVKTHLSKGDRGIIHSLVALAHKREMEGDFILPDWSNVTLEEYNEFRISPEYQSAQAGLPNPNAARPGSQVVSSFAKVRDPLSDYRRGVRRDPNAFTVLKEDKQWDSWQRGTELKICPKFWTRILSLQHPKLQNSLLRNRSFLCPLRQSPTQ